MATTTTTTAPAVAREAKPALVSILEAVESTVYDVVARGQLPAFDPKRTVKKAVVPAHHLARVNKMLVHWSRWIACGYLSGIVLRVVSVVVSARVAQYTAVLSLLVQIPAVINVVFQFRVGFLLLLVKTYDFWYYLATNVVWALCFAWYFADWRVAIVPVMLVDVQNATLLDSFLQDFFVIVMAVWIWCGFLCGVMVAVSLDAVDSVESDATLLTTRVRTVRLKEVLLNAIGTIVILIVRVIYRRRAALRSQRKSTERLVQSITYRWPLKLQPRTMAKGPSASSPSLDPAATVVGSFTAAVAATRWSAQRQVGTRTLLQLQISTRSKPLHARDIVAPQVLQLFFRLPFSRWLHWIVRIAGGVGLCATPSVFLLPKELPTRIVHGVALVAISGTTLYCCTLFCFFQRKLLRRVCYSFDFAFISLQLSCAHLCVADLYQWRLAPTLAVASSWLWIHTVMTLDALIPVMRQLLSYQSWFRVPVLLLFTAWGVLLWLELFVWDSQQFQDRRIFHLAIGNSRNVQLHVVPFLASRLLSVGLWCMRMLFRIATRESDHDLLMVQSHVAFDAKFQRKKSKRRSFVSDALRNRIASITPGPLNPSHASPVKV